MTNQRAPLTIAKISRWWEVQYKKSLVKYFPTRKEAETFCEEWKYDDIRNILKGIGKEQLVRRSPKSGGWVNRMHQK